MPLGLRPLNLTPTGPAVNVTLLHDFVKHPPACFSVKERLTRWTKKRRSYLSLDPTKITSCARSAKGIFSDSKGGCLWVHTEAELETLTETLLTLPIFLTACLKRDQRKSSKKIIEHTGKAAVIVNTQNVHIQHHFKTLLAEAMDIMREGKNFAVELDFDQVLEEWLEAVFVGRGEEGNTWPYGNTRYVSRHAKITVTNCSERSPWFTCPGCSKTTCRVLSWGFLLPCCCLVCPIYRLQRYLRVTDLGGKVPEDVYASAFNPVIEISDADLAHLDNMRHTIQNFARSHDSPIKIDSVGRVL